MLSNCIVTVTKVNTSEAPQFVQHEISWKNPNILLNGKDHSWCIWTVCVHRTVEIMSY